MLSIGCIYIQLAALINHLNRSNAIFQQNVIKVFRIIIPQLIKCIITCIIFGKHIDGRFHGSSNSPSAGTMLTIRLTDSAAEPVALSKHRCNHD